MAPFLGRIGSGGGTTAGFGFGRKRGTLKLPPGLIEYLVVAGGGAGGKIWLGSPGPEGTPIISYGGGGGGGQVLSSSSYSVTSGINYPITVGAGGTSIAAPAQAGVRGISGDNSNFGPITAIGGGGGGSQQSALSGGSGGGSGTPSAGAPGNGTGTFPGGAGIGPPSGTMSGGGGGGAGGAGATGTAFPSPPPWIGGAGGNGIESFIEGVPKYFGGGGGGGYSGPGGLGGGGANSNGGTNTGGGGAGGSYATGGNFDNLGGPGIVIIAYPDANSEITIVDGNLVYTKLTTRPGYNVYKFTSGSGNIKF